MSLLKIVPPQEKMIHNLHIHLFDDTPYGNQDFSTGMISPGLTSSAWVSGSLKISPKEQVKFIQKMIQGRLPVSKSALQMTKNLLFQEEMSRGQKLFGKTGLGNAVDENGETVKARWFAGWVESDQGFFPFAYLLQEREINPLQTIPRVKELLDQSELKKLIKEICKIRPFKLAELAKIFRKSPRYLRDSYLTEIIDRKELKHLFSDQTAHPLQAYQTSTA